MVAEIVPRSLVQGVYFSQQRRLQITLHQWIWYMTYLVFGNQNRTVGATSMRYKNLNSGKSLKRVFFIS